MNFKCFSEKLTIYDELFAFVFAIRSIEESFREES